MSKQRVKVLKVENDIMYEKDARFGGGQQHGSRITLEANGQTEVKTLSDFSINSSPALRAQLQSLASASLPVEVVLERTTKSLQNGKTYEAITAVLPKTTAILPEEEFKPKPPFGGGRSFAKGGSTYSPKMTAINAASRLGGTAEEVIANARKFEAYLAEDKKVAESLGVPQSTTAPASVEQTVKFEF